MIGVAIATAAAGIVVGTVSLTGIGLVMTEVVELISGGNLMIMLLLTAVICLILGMGLPTTANYIVVATLMAPVIVELAAKSDLAVPLVAAHLFVFYFGLMADVTPPVGLASFAAAAISGASLARDRRAGLPLRDPHCAAALHLRLQQPAPADRRRQHLLCRHHHRRLDHRDAALRGGNAGLVPGEEPLVGDGRCSSSPASRCSGPASSWIESTRHSRPCRRANSNQSSMRCRQAGTCGSASSARTCAAIRSIRPLRCGSTRRARPTSASPRQAWRSATRTGSLFVDDVRFRTEAAKIGLDLDYEIVSGAKPHPRPPKELFYLLGLALAGLVAWNQRRRSSTTIHG